MDREVRNPAFPRMIDSFCRQRASQLLPPREVELLAAYMIQLFERAERPPNRGRGLDWRTIAAEAGIDATALLACADSLRPGFEALRRELNKPTGRPRGRPRKAPAHSLVVAKSRSAPHPRKARQEPCEFPEPTCPEWVDPTTFAAAFDLHLSRHQDTLPGLVQVLARAGHPLPYSTLRMWRLGAKAPRHRASYGVLAVLERRWGLPSGYFAGKLAAGPFAITSPQIADVSAPTRRRLAWHLPHDFERRSKAEQDEIVAWVQNVVISGNTEYRRYQRNAAKHRFARRLNSETVAPISAARRRSALG